MRKRLQPSSQTDKGLPVESLGSGWVGKLARVCRPGEEAFVITSISVSAIGMPGKSGSELMYFAFALTSIGIYAVLRHWR
jgi:hypothetical protein